MPPPEEVVSLFEVHDAEVVERDDDPSHASLRRRRRRQTAAEASPGTPLSVASPPRGSGQFSVQLQYLSGVNQFQRNSFDYAAARLSKMITTQHKTVGVPSALRCQPFPNQSIPSFINGVLIYIQVEPMDGESGTRSRTGQCVYDSSGYVRVGYILFDSADANLLVSNNKFDAACLHDMLHVLGVGNYAWDKHDLVKDGTGADPRYTGSGGIRGFWTMAPDTPFDTVPLESTGGGGGTASHWRESVFGHELMTPSLDQAYAPLSLLTLGSLADLGYFVDASAADEYTQFNPTPSPTSFPLAITAPPRPSVQPIQPYTPSTGGGGGGGDGTVVVGAAAGEQDNMWGLSTGLFAVVCVAIVVGGIGALVCLYALCCGRGKDDDDDSTPPRKPAAPATSSSPNAATTTPALASEEEEDGDAEENLEDLFQEMAPVGRQAPPPPSQAAAAAEWHQKEAQFAALAPSCTDPVTALRYLGRTGGDVAAAAALYAQDQDDLQVV